ncbi:MAG TPA: L-threonylcarbamoyladenylate synthase [Candidatus Baltobacteraceae bacterium]|nr:L-threonylcarbamoyladenylate synthase [Candidatus Baltobacteraceae bacterium]
MPSARGCASGFSATPVSNVIDARKESRARVCEEVAAVINGGGTVIFPTDTVYGIGCDPYDPKAIAAIYGAKVRPPDKPLSLHLASVTEFLEYASAFKEAANAARRLMPGPVTIIVPRPTFIDHDVTAGLPSLGFRVPDDALCAAILDRCGPLAATSANLSGRSAYYGGEGAEHLPDADLFVANGPTKYARDSTVMDMTGTTPRVLREGVLSAERLTELLGTPVAKPRARENT